MKTILLPLFIVCALNVFAQRLPRNPKPNLCYVRTVTPNEYDVWYEDHLTYSAEEAALYPHKKIEYVLAPQRNMWEFAEYKGCRSDDPAECQVLCYRKIPATVHIIYAPLDTTMGNPYYEELQFMELVKRGGLASWHEIDCQLVNFNYLPISLEGKQVEFRDSDYDVFDDVLLTFLEEHPNMRLEIGAFTDSRGEADYNFEITRERADAIVDYLVWQGINPERLVGRGYGETRPINGCGNGVDCPDWQHDENNRIAFKVMNIEIN
ncbi:MAG: OmpA family protein [Bacteroidota bacterium]